MLASFKSLILRTVTAMSAIKQQSEFEQAFQNFLRALQGLGLDLQQLERERVAAFPHLAAKASLPQVHAPVGENLKSEPVQAPSLSAAPVAAKKPPKIKLSKEVPEESEPLPAKEEPKPHVKEIMQPPVELESEAREAHAESPLVPPEPEKGEGELEKTVQDLINQEMMAIKLQLIQEQENRKTENEASPCPARWPPTQRLLACPR